ncbi:MAG: folate-binding protein, partial [Bauldia litoralis]
MTDGEAKTLVRDDRAFVGVAGPEARSFLQGLLSQDVEKATPERSAYGALLTPQGKFLHDLFLTELGGGVVLECERERADDLTLRLKRYRLRSKVEIAHVEGWSAAVVFGADPFGLGEAPGATRREGDLAIYVDPRLAALGVRVVGPSEAVQAKVAGYATGAAADYRRFRLSLGVPEGAEDIPVDRGFLLENGFDELNGVDWRKGCYVGQ